METLPLYTSDNFSLFPQSSPLSIPFFGINSTYVYVISSLYITHAHAHTHTHTLTVGIADLGTKSSFNFRSYKERIESIHAIATLGCNAFPLSIFCLFFFYLSLLLLDFFLSFFYRVGHRTNNHSWSVHSEFALSPLSFPSLISHRLNRKMFLNRLGRMQAWLFKRRVFLGLRQRFQRDNTDFGLFLAFPLLDALFPLVLPIF